jgi:sugar phosphate isomerase/epimerase
MEAAFKYTKMAGYDAIELSAIGGMSEHLVIERWREVAGPIKELVKQYELPISAMEQPSQDPQVMEQAMQAAVEIGIPIINCGPGGTSDDEASFQQSVESLGRLAEMAQKYGVLLCVKAHVGAAIYNTPTTKRALALISNPAFGLDMDPSHIYRGNENPVEAIAEVITRIRHVHIRDCKGRQQNPGTPPMQANGRGDIDLVGYLRVLHQHGYDGPVDLEVIGAKDMPLIDVAIIAAESRGHMQACLQACGAR